MGRNKGWGKSKRMGWKGTERRESDRGGREASLAWPPPHKILDPPLITFCKDG